MPTVRISHPDADTVVDRALQAAQVRVDDRERQRLARFIARHADLASAASQPSDAPADFAQLLQGLARE